MRYPRYGTMRKSGIISLEEWAEKKKNEQGKPTTRPATTAPATGDKKKGPDPKAPPKPATGSTLKIKVP